MTQFCSIGLLREGGESNSPTMQTPMLDSTDMLAELGHGLWWMTLLAPNRLLLVEQND